MTRAEKDIRYRTIKQVSELLDINSHVIRYWDSKFDGLSIRLHSKKQRFFNGENIKKIINLQKTLYNNGKHNYSLDLAKKILDQDKKYDKSAANINSSADNNFLNKNSLNIDKLKNIRFNLSKLLESL